MWIRSQSKKSLIKVKGLVINTYKEDTTIEDADTYIVLGTYPIERALEVLDEVERYRNSDLEMNLNVYEMPEE